MVNWQISHIFHVFLLALLKIRLYLVTREIKHTESVNYKQKYTPNMVKMLACVQL